jgi:hypothetical protein
MGWPKSSYRSALPTPTWPIRVVVDRRYALNEIRMAIGRAGRIAAEG